YPNTIGADGLAILLEKPCKAKENKNSLGHHLKSHLEEYLNPEHAGALIRELNRLVQRPPHIRMEKRETRISGAFEFLVELLPLVLTRLLASGSLTEEQQGDAAESLTLLAEAEPYHNHRVEGLGEIDGITRPHPAVRRCFFWQTLERTRGEDGAAPSPWSLMHDFRTVMEPN